MTWVRLDDGFCEHPKVVACGPLAIALEVAAISYCNRQLTDGFVPGAIARRLIAWETPSLEGVPMPLAATWENEMFAGAEDVTSEYVIGVLVSAGLWTEVPGGYRIHDYNDYQPSRAVVEEKRKQEHEAKSTGGKVRAENAPRNPDGTFASQQETPGQAQDIQQPSSPIPSRTQPNQKGALVLSAKPDDQQQYLARWLAKNVSSKWSELNDEALLKLSAGLGTAEVRNALRHAKEDRIEPMNAVGWVVHVAREESTA